MADRNQIAKQRERHKFALNQAGKKMQDSTGKQLKQGQIVHIPLNGVFQGQIVRVVDSVLAVPGRQPHPPHVLVELHIPKVVADAMGNVPLIYVVGDAVEQETAAPEPESKLVMPN